MERATHKHMAQWRASGEWFRVRLNHASTALQGLASESGIEVDDMLIYRARKDEKLPPDRTDGSFAVTTAS